MADIATMPESMLWFASANPMLACTGNLEWDTRFAEWLRLDGLLRANYAFGDMARAREEYDNAKWCLSEKYGKRFRSIPKADSAHSEAFQAIRAAEDRSMEQFGTPMWKACTALAETPAPNLAAALFKIELIKREELDNDASIARDAMEIVIEDMERLRPRSAP